MKLLIATVYVDQHSCSKYIFCNTTSQLDPSYSEELNFTTQKDVLRFVMPDCLEEFRTLLIYEIAHVSGLAQ